MHDLNQHKKAIRNYIIFKNQLHDMMKIKSNQKKNMKSFYFNKKILQYIFAFENMIVLYQKKTEKLKFKWKNSFMILKFDAYEISYRLQQLNEKKIKKTFHENHLKFFRSKKKYFADSIILSIYQIIRKSRVRKNKL